MRTASLVLIGTLALVAACKEDKPAAPPPPTQGQSTSPEPTTEEMKALIAANIKADVDRGLPQMSARAGRNLPGFQGITMFENQGCVPTALPAPGVNCTFRLTLRINDRENTTANTGFFMRDQRGAWIFRPGG